VIRFISTEPNSRRWDEFYTLDNGKVKHRYYTGTAFNVKILSKSKALSVINTLSDYMKLDTNDTPIPGPGL
jgi:hypothetical protein